MDTASSRTVTGDELLEKLDKGIFGAVNRARQLVGNRQVAVKAILPNFANQLDFA